MLDVGRDPSGYEGLCARKNVALQQRYFGYYRPVKTEFRYNRVKLGILTILSAILSVAPLATLIGARPEWSMALLLLGVGVFFGLWGAIFAAQLQQGGVVLSITRDGILDRRIGPKTIPWRDIREVYLYRARSQRFMAVIVDDPKKYAEPPGWADAMVLWANQTIGLAQFSLPLLGLEGTAAHVLAAVMEYLPDHVKQDRLVR